ncbi:MAG: hypothetical protein BAA04_00565 [Firmicutes bacterium ZCTH02-B6]|nr:MAG: hypothetical protein BAA04_00565 [Firmicutes bacterium ZCTH02-B6]
MIKRLAAAFVAALLLLALAPVAPAQEASLPGMLAAAERAIYGSEQAGSLIERVSRVERDVYGETQTGPLLVRIQDVYGYLVGIGGPYSIGLQLNVVEYLVFQRMNIGVPVSRRLEDLERSVLGTTQQLPLAERVRSLVEMVWPSGELNVRQVTVPKETLVKIHLLTEINSGTSRVGQRVRYRVVDDVMIDDRVVIPAGAEGEGEITAVQSAGRFGQSGRVEVNWGTVPAIDGTRVQLNVSTRAAQQNQELAVAASMAGVILLGPVGLVGGLFVQGQEHVVPVGTQFYVEVDRETQALGLSLTPTR